MLTKSASVAKTKPHVNLELEQIKGNLNDKEARISLTRFLYNNIVFAFKLLADFSLFPFQEMILKSWIKKNFSLNIWSRGGSKSWTVAVFCIVYGIFNPNTKIVVVSMNFRRSREIMLTMEKLLNSKPFAFFKACFKEIHKRPDIWEWTLENGSSIVALPLASGQGIRGQRADVLIVDEFMLISEEIYNSILFPFLIARTGIQDILKIKAVEDDLIKRGIMKEEDREVVKSLKKVIGLSSASYQFEFLYKKFCEWIKLATGEKADEKVVGDYFISQLSCDFFPPELIDDTMKAEAKESMSDSVYMREFGAQFVSDSSGYFKASKMEACTMKDGQMPCVEVIGDKDAKYILSVDTSSSASDNSDHFAMDLIKLIPENKTGVLVHNYAVAGGDLKDHIKYFFYLLKYFNNVAIILDGTGGGRGFVEACNESVTFKEANLELKFWDADFDNTAEPIKVLKEAKKTYNLNTKTIVYLQQFNTESIRRMNENLQAKIDRKGIFFASRICCPQMEDTYNNTWKLNLGIFEAGERSIDAQMIDFLESQDEMIQLTKDECALIEVKTTPLGALTFDLPDTLRKSNSPNKTRKDSYSALLMAVHMMKIWYDMEDFKDDTVTFTPFMG